MKKIGFNLIYRFFLLLFVTFLGLSNSKAQSTVTVKVIGLKIGDTCTVQIQKSSANFQFKKLVGKATGTPEHTFSNLSNGKWALKLDATGYYFPSAQVFELSGSPKTIEITLNPITISNSTNYLYQWQDDSSFVGHAQQSYINEPNEINVLSDKINIPSDFSSILLLNRHGIALSDKINSWTPEDAFRLFQTVKRLPSLINNNDKASVASVWYITDQDVIDDIQILDQGNIKYVTISRKAFLYASPLVVTLDGLKGRFYSKRLYKALVNFATNFGYNSGAIDQLALSQFGIRFLTPGAELQQIMSEDYSNFQSFSAFEKITILSMFEELPDGMHIQNNLKYLVHRIAGQSNPTYPNAAAIAWVGLKTIEFMQSAFESTKYSDIQRLMLHEKAHFLWDGLFDQKLRDDWATIGGWFLDPTAKSGWTTSNTTEFVSAYSHGNNPNEDMAESIAAYVVNPEILRSRSLRKFEFIRDRVMQGTRYISILRKDLTFQVYNLYPDYNYPGKIKKVEVKVNGLPNEDKEIILRIELNKIDEKQEGASSGYTVLFSAIGTSYGLYLAPVDNGKGFVLEGKRKISKFSKSGYWTVNQIALSDDVGNQRFENNSTFGIKIFINNPLEDYEAPRYVENTLKLTTGFGKFYNSFGPREDPQGDVYQTIQAKFDIKEYNTLGTAGLQFATPKIDEKGVYQQDIGFQAINNDPNYIKKDSINKSINHVIWKYPIPEYFPTGHYLVTLIDFSDDAQNTGRAFFMNDTSAFNLPPNATKHLRDSIYVKTKYPDFVPPIIDVNQISVKATPSKPLAPDGETLFEMEFFARDSSSFVGNEAGVKMGNYSLRNPQGNVFNFSMVKDFDNPVYISGTLKDPWGSPGNWRKYKVSTLLPKGSAPGLWGVESITLFDRAYNKKYYNLTEIVRFDLEKADTSKLVQPKVEILGKKVNAKNVEALNLSISCKDCKNQNYRARFYSSMGGISVINEGKMTKDSIVLENINLSGVNDGILYATVFILDSTKTMLGIGKSIYAKDVLSPKSGILKTNLSNFGKSNIDSLIYLIKATESKGSYTLRIKQLSISPGNQSINSPMLSKTLKGIFYNSNISVKDSDLKEFEDGLIEITCILTDSVDNESIPVITNIYKDTRDPILNITKTSSLNGKVVLNISSNEFIANSLSNEDISLKNGSILSIKKLNNRNFEILINRTCSDSLSIKVIAGKLLDSVGNKNQSISLNLLDIQKPSTPMINVVNFQNLSTTASGTYQWFLNNISISGATQNNYIATSSGSYTLVVTNSQGCTSSPSAAINIMITGIMESPDFSVYPNPVSDRITILTNQEGDVEIVNILGVIVKKIQSIHSGETIDFSRFSKGKYFIRFTNQSEKSITIPVVKD